MKTTSAHIALNRNRLRSYGKSVYLKDKSNFEIELFNGENVEVLAKIWLNGIPISNKGLVLKPGQRFFLDRFIDTNNKFLFETYEVDATVEAQAAIKDNGMIKVSFYSEESPYVFPIGEHYNWQYYHTPIPIIYNGNIGSPSTGISTNINYSHFTNTSTFNNSTLDTTRSKGTLETGRIEKGESSNQLFTNVDKKFNQFAFHTVEMQILPLTIGERDVEVSQIRNYCTACGTRVKKSSWKFCPSCGERIN